VDADAQTYGVLSTLMMQVSLPKDVAYKFAKYVFSEDSKAYMRLTTSRGMRRRAFLS
jgi:hypothetical protein